MSPLGFVAAILLLIAPVAASTAALTETTSHEAAPGTQLIRLLQDPAQRDRAYYELWRRAHRDKDRGFDAFLETHYDVEVVTCPQEQGQPPVYLVLHGYLSSAPWSGKAAYRISNPEQLFPPRPRSFTRNGSGPAIDAFTADGDWILPFGGNNVLEGTLADINADGLIERIELTAHCIDGVDTAEVLEISTVKPKAHPLLAVLVNWGDDEWTYRLGEPDAQGIPPIELGPRIGDTMKTKAVFRWDVKTGAFVGPKARRGDHFLRLAAGDVSKQLSALKTRRPPFRKDRDFKEPPPRQLSPRSPKPSPPPAAPYQRQSLAKLSDVELLKRMGPGRKAYHFEQASILRDHLPSDFWTLTPKRAALTLVESHRTKEHRESFQLALDDGAAAPPPAAGSIAVTYSSSRCYNAIDAFYFLRFDPTGSYLAFARTSAGGAVFYNVVHDQPAFDLRVCPLSYEDAHHLAATLWWLDHMRTRTLDRQLLGAFNMSSSTADGSASLTFRNENGVVLQTRSGIRWAAEISQRWSSDFNHETFVNFASYLIADTLPERLGKAWTDAAPRSDDPAFLHHNKALRYTDEDLRHLASLTTRLLGDFSPDQDRVSFAIVAAAADAAGTLGFHDARPSLEKILATLPEPKPMRTYEDVSRERTAAYRERPSDPKAQAALNQKLKALEAEQDAIIHESSPSSARYLREVAASSLRKLAVADDPEALHTWAVAREEGSQWALQRLSRLDTVRYVRALESWMKALKPHQARQLFDEIARVDSARATAIAAAVPSDRADALTVSAFSVLDQANQFTDEQQRVTALIAVLHDPKSGWEQRGKAIDLLVPADQPLRYPQRAIDDALLRALAPDQADDVVNFTIASACRALALRRRTETFDRMEKILRSPLDPYLYGRILHAAALLVQADPAHLSPRLLKIVTPELTATNKPMNEILWAIWAADLRSLGPKLEQLGTSGPDDYEDEKASTSGGQVSPVKGRFHLARKIADTWNATDPVTQIRLLTALVAEESYHLTEEPNPALVHRFQASLREAARTLTPPQRERLDAFFRTVLEQPDTDEPPSPEALRKLVQLAQTTLQENR